MNIVDYILYAYHLVDKPWTAGYNKHLSSSFFIAQNVNEICIVVFFS